MAALTLVLVFASGASPARAQGSNRKEAEVWRLETLHQGFCVQFLVAGATLARELPEATRPLPASRASDLHPALRSVVDGQPEYAAWTPSNLCLFYFEAVDARGQRVHDDNPLKAPMLALWTVAAVDSQSGSRQDLALEVLTNSGRLERSGSLGDLEINTARSSVAPVPPDEEGVPSGLDRYRLRIRGTQLIWDGRPGVDSARVDAPLAREWRVARRRGGWMPGKLTLAPVWSRAMIGSLKVEGKDDLAKMLKASPIRFVGPAYYGGAGVFEFGR